MECPMTNHHPRRNKLAKPALQLRVIAVFLLLAVSVQVVQCAVLWHAVSALEDQLPGYATEIAALLHQKLAWILAASLIVTIPLTLIVGALTTFPIAGPVYRMERHLAAVAAGETAAPCTIRDGDELQELCEAINRVIAKLPTPASGNAAPQFDSAAKIVELQD
ncbi:MAG: hypothetical protein ACKVX7_14305 [Planctomycetota bacterium]